MAWAEDDLLQLSGIQHFAFCPRQWALIHLEQVWQENYLTAEGRVLHRRAHDASASETRGDTVLLRDVRVSSTELGVSGACDVVELRADPRGVQLAGRAGRWQPYPVEYKRGKPKTHRADELQLCCQAMCLEEMLCCSIPEGALFYAEPRRRQVVALDDGLRALVRTMLTQMHEYAARGHTPKVKPTAACRSCSINELCLPALCRKKSAKQYISAALGEVGQCENS